MYAVEEVAYHILVGRMALVGVERMGKVLSEQLAQLPKPCWQNEVKYFWTALFNAARESNEVVWLWLCTQPHIRHFAPPEAEFQTRPQFVQEMSLPVIGGSDDEPVRKVERPKQWPAEPTEENFQEQTAALDVYLKAEGVKNHSNRCKSIQDYVATFYHSGTAQIQARVQLTETGYHALATQEGIKYLLRAYPSEGR